MPRIRELCVLRGGMKSLDLKPPEAIVLMALASYDGSKGIRVSQQTIADGTGISRERIGSIIHRLAKRSIIRIVEPGRQHKAALIEITVRCDATSHLHRNVDAKLTPVRCDATSHLQANPDVTQRGHLKSDPDVTQRHKSNKRLTEPGLPSLARSGPARPSGSQALRAAEDESRDQEGESRSSAPSGVEVPPDGAEGATQPRHHRDMRTSQRNHSTRARICPTASPTTSPEPVARSAPGGQRESPEGQESGPHRVRSHRDPRGLDTRRRRRIRRDRHRSRRMARTHGARRHASRCRRRQRVPPREACALRL